MMILSLNIACFYCTFILHEEILCCEGLPATVIRILLRFCRVYAFADSNFSEVGWQRPWISKIPGTRGLYPEPSRASIWLRVNGARAFVHKG